MVIIEIIEWMQSSIVIIDGASRSQTKMRWKVMRMLNSMSNDRLIYVQNIKIITFMQLFQPSGRHTYIINIERHCADAWLKSIRPVRRPVYTSIAKEKLKKITHLLKTLSFNWKLKNIKILLWKILTPSTRYEIHQFEQNYFSSFCVQHNTCCSTKKIVKD